MLQQIVTFAYPYRLRPVICAKLLFGPIDIRENRVHGNVYPPRYLLGIDALPVQP